MQIFLYFKCIYTCDEFVDWVEAKIVQCNAAEFHIQVVRCRIYGLEGGLKEFFLAVAKTVLSATMKYAAPATVYRMCYLLDH